MMMIYCNYLFILSIIFSLASANIKNVTRQGRIFTFNTDQQDIQVGLDFSIPFISIPIQNKFDASAGFILPGLNFPKININPTALGIGGLLLLVTSLITPFFSFHQFSRSSRADESFHDDAMSMSEKFEMHSGGCPQRFACWISQRSINEESVEIWKQVISNDLISTIVNTSSLTDAMSRGMHGYNCEAYKPCPIRKENIPRLLKSINILSNKKIYNT